METQRFLPAFLMSACLVLVPLSAAAHGGPHVESVQPQPVGTMAQPVGTVERIDPTETAGVGRQQIRGGGCASCAIAGQSTPPLGGLLLSGGLAGALWMRFRRRLRRRR